MSRQVTDQVIPSRKWQRLSEPNVVHICAGVDMIVDINPESWGWVRWLYVPSHERLGTYPVRYEVREHADA